RSCRPGLTRRTCVNVLDAVATDTPASLATSLMVGVLPIGEAIAKRISETPGLTTARSRDYAPILTVSAYRIAPDCEAFGNLHMGYGAAMAWILLVVIAISTVAIFASSRYWVFYMESER